MMDPTFDYAASAEQVIAAASAFGDDEDFTIFDQSYLLGTTLPDEGLSFITETVPFTMPVDFPAFPLETPPLSGFEGYLEGNFDFDESLVNNGVDLSWGAEMYNQAFAPGMDNLHVPSLSSTASESQGLSPETLLLPYTPPEATSFVPSTIPSPSSSAVSPSSSHQTTTPRKSSSSTGPKYVPPQEPPSNSTYEADLPATRRQLRKLIKPETCPVCGKGHAQLRERDRHIITQHYDEAVRMGLNVARAECSICDQTFRRKDHLTRHMKRRHGW